MIRPIIRSMIRPIVRGIVKSFGDSFCNTYLFNSADADYLSIEPFTGNLKVILAAESEADVHPDIVAGRIGDFVPSTKVTGYDWELNGTSYGEFPEMELAGTYTISAEFIIGAKPLSNESLVGGRTFGGGSDFTLYIDSSGNLSLQAPRAGQGSAYFPLGAVDVGLNKFSLEFDGISTFSGNMNGIPFSVAVEGVITPLIAYIGSWARELLFNGSIKNLKVTGITNTTTYPSGTAHFKLDEPYSDDHQFIDSDNGVIGTKYNDLAEDYTAITESTPLTDPQWNQYEIEAVGVEYIVGALFTGVVGRYAKDDVWYSVNMGKEEVTRWLWTPNGTSYLTLATMSMNPSTTLTLHFFGDSSALGNLQYIWRGVGYNQRIGSDGVLYFDTTCTVDGVAVNSGEVMILDDQWHTVVITQAYVVADEMFGLNGTNCFKCPVTYVEVVGINDTDYPTGRVEWVLDTYAPDNNYQYTSTDNGEVAQMVNGAPEDFTEI